MVVLLLLPLPVVVAVGLALRSIERWCKRKSCIVYTCHFPLKATIFHKLAHRPCARVCVRAPMSVWTKMPKRSMAFRQLIVEYHRIQTGCGKLSYPQSISIGCNVPATSSHTLSAHFAIDIFVQFCYCSLIAAIISPWFCVCVCASKRPNELNYLCCFCLAFIACIEHVSVIHCDRKW